MNSFFKTACYSLTLAATVVLLTPGCAAQSAATQFGLSRNSTQTVAPTDTGVMDPDKATEQAPTQFKALFQTTKGDFTIQVTRAWAPNGADRFYNMVKVGYFNDVAIYRAIQGFMFQFGIHGNPNVNEKWSNSTIPDDPSVGISNTPGTISFAQTQKPGSRSVQMFVNLGMNAMLDTPQGATGSPFVPFGKVVSGASVMEKINTEYGENPRGENIQGNFKAKGNDYILKRFTRIDMIKSVTIVKD